MPDWERIATLFEEVVALGPEARSAHLRTACGDDEALLREVESLVAHHHESATLLDQPAMGHGFSVAAGDLADKAQPMIGRVIGRYRIDAHVDAGGMGTVFRGSRHDGVMEQTVAIKLLHPWKRSPQLVRRFQHEWQTLARLTHPNIAQVLDAGLTDDGTPFLVMEFVDGLPLDDYADRHHLSIAERLALIETIAHSVHFAHQNLVVHRDLKPANILVTPQGTPKLLDFGIAKVLDASETDQHASVTRTKMMTPDYASPEQLRGDSITTATDIYSLGVVMYELLSGRRPYQRTTASPVQIESVLADRDPPRPSTAAGRAARTTETENDTTDAIARRRGATPHRLGRQLRGDVDNIVMMALRKDPARRYASAEQLAEDIRRHLLGHTVVARRDTLLYRTRKLITRNKVASAIGGLALVAVVASVAMTLRQARLAAREAVRAQSEAARALDEAEHARIEATSTERISDVLTDAILASIAERSDAEREDIRRVLARHVRSTRHEFSDQNHLRANILDALGKVFLDLDDSAQAERLIEEAAEIRDREFGGHSLEAALSAESRGMVARRRGDDVAAAEWFRRALELHRSLPLGVHTDIAQAANNLSVAMRALGDLDQALALQTEALAIRRAELGTDHPLTAESMNNLAVIHLQRGELDRVKELLTETLRIRRQRLGEGHPLVAQTVNNLAALAQRRGDLAGAERELRAAVEMFRSIPGVDEDGLAPTLTNLAKVLRLARRSEDARTVAQEALDIDRRLFGTDRHPRVLSTLQVLASIESDLGDHESAIRHHEEVLAATRALFPEGHRRIGLSLNDLGSVLVDAGQPTRAEAMYREALAIFEAPPEPEVPLLAAARFGLGLSLAHQRRFEEAETPLLSAHEHYRELGMGSVNVTAKALHDLYIAWGKPEMAARHAPR